MDYTCANGKTGLSNTGQLQGLRVTIEEMTPEEYKNGGESLSINYSFTESPFGDILIAATQKGICYLSFADDRENSLKTFRKKFPKAKYHCVMDEMQQNAISAFEQDHIQVHEIRTHLKGTEFQRKVWEALLDIPIGKSTTYGKIAAQIKHPKACRAVGTAVGENPVSFLIPCHRVIRSTGELGGYHWGISRKIAIRDRETAGLTKGCPLSEG